MATVPSTSSLLSYSYTVREPERTVRYIRTHDEALIECHASAIALQGPFLGLDIEWKPSWGKGAPERPAALIQLASRHIVLLFQIHWIGYFPPVLMALLQDPDIKKVGVGIRGDVAKLQKDWNINIEGVIDLSELAWEMDAKHWHTVRNSGKRSAIGLARLVERYLGLRLDKPKAVSRSDWERPLTERQRIYAANDAAAGYDLQEYFTMEPRVDVGPSTAPSTSTPPCALTNK